MKNVLLFLSMKPHDGGKFQYSINILDTLSLLAEKDQFELAVLYNDEVWKEYVTTNALSNKASASFIEKKIRRLFIYRFNLVMLWRFIGKYLDPVQRVIYRLKPDLIFYPGNDSMAYECSLPSVIPIFDLMHRYESRFVETAEKTVYEQRERHYKNVCKYAKYILVDSELGKRHVLESYKVDEKKIIVLPYIPPRYVYEKIDSTVLEKFNLPEEFIFYPAQFWTHKNHIAILNALCILRDEYKISVNAVFVGSPKNGYDEIVRKTQELKLGEQITILGYVTNQELVALYKKAKALVFPSYFGPTNIPPIEGLAVGCPVIVSDIYAHRDQLGNAVSYFDPSNYSQLAESIRLFFVNESPNSVQQEKENVWNEHAQLQRIADNLEKTLNF